ncbi:5-carboxymethyl-2-hydroxymuconate Delta-isomerase [Pseudokordiimonas caeni]|uniref:5-carboxymethyl-2-hydroxymuconate Delta-isomerase n=1 Tax=Pseudokordiimonas caeni TaxID=2997908 RepID=UPI002811E0DF|nr:5-carboxymethyl-2-hydroxymuconate Delta-isomerase [Pseudokordiimonas caeni]
MPHIIAEYSREIERSADIKALVRLLHDSAMESGLFTAPSIKTRAVPVDHALVGGKDGNFMHVTVHLYKGRTTEQKLALTELLLQRLASLKLPLNSLSIDAIDTDKDVYVKIEDD